MYSKLSLKKYAELVNLCILESLEKVILEKCFKLLETYFKLFVFAAYNFT